MYERKVVHAIQHSNEKEFHLRYRIYNTEVERDRTFALVKNERKDISRVTLTVTAETVPEQTVFFDERNGSEH